MVIWKKKRRSIANFARTMTARRRKLFLLLLSTKRLLASVQMTTESLKWADAKTPKKKSAENPKSLKVSILAMVAVKTTTKMTTTITTNVRQIEGVIKRLTAYKEILDSKIDTQAVKRAIKDVVRIGTYIPSPQLIIRESALYYSLTEEDLRGQNRSKNTAIARQIAMYLIRTLTNLSLKEIGAEFGDRNHSTVISSIKKIEDMIKTDPTMAATVRDITSNINSN